MQYYVYNNLNSQNEYQKVFVDGIQAASREISIGKQLFEIFTTFSSEPPIGALPLNGYEIPGCISKLPEFWTQCVKRKANHTIPCVSGLDVYNQISGTQNGNCGYFYIQDDTNASDYGTVKLPCLNTAVLTNTKQLKEVNGIISGSDNLISSELGAYYKGNNISHNHIYDDYTTGYNATTKNYYIQNRNSSNTVGIKSVQRYTEDEGSIQANPAHIKVYYWIQVFTSYITQDLDGKLQVTSDNISGYVDSLDSITE